MGFWKIITVVVVGIVALLTLKYVGWIGRDPAADIKVTPPEVAAPVIKAPPVAASRAAMRPKKRKRIATGSVSTEETRVQSAPAGGSRADGVPTAPERQPYVAKLPTRSKVTLGNATLGCTFTLVETKVSPEALKILINVQSSTGGSVGVWNGSFSLLVNNGWIEPKMSFRDRWNSGEPRLKEVIFDIPPALNSAVLRIEAYGGNVEIPLDLTPPASPQ